jgi:hypothetical protein
MDERMREIVFISCSRIFACASHKLILMESYELGALCNTSNIYITCNPVSRSWLHYQYSCREGVRCVNILAEVSL